jgi:uncharacterized protein YkwD
MKRKLITKIIYTGAAVLLISQACSRLSPAETNDPEVSFEPLKNLPKISLKQNDFQKGQKMVAIVDHDCMDQKAPSAFSFSAEATLDRDRIDGLPIQAYQFFLSSQETLQSIREKAAQDECLLSITTEKDFKIDIASSDPLTPQQYYFNTINAYTARNGFFPAETRLGVNTNVTVAVIDTGIELTHPDLIDSLWTNSDGDHGYDCLRGIPVPADDNGHGTHVSGIIAAGINNGIGVEGLMGSRAKILSYKAFRADGTGSLSCILNGISFAVRNGAKVINLSLGYVGLDEAFRTYLNWAVSQGVFVATAAGNDGLAMVAGDPARVSIPGAYAKDIFGVMNVGSIDAQTLAKSSFSNYSNTLVEMSAPGSNMANGIMSTWLNASYTFKHGTSMSAPMVSAAAALAVGFTRSRGFVISPAHIENLISQTAYVQNGLLSYFKGGKILNLGGLYNVLNTNYPYSINVQPIPDTPTTTTLIPVNDNGCSTLSVTECELFRAINRERVEAGVSRLRLNSRCINGGQLHAKDMAFNEYFDHNGLNETAEDRFIRLGLGRAALASNIAYGFPTAETMLSAWMMSNEGHRETLLDPSFQSFGVGVSNDSKGILYSSTCFSALPGDL